MKTRLGSMLTVAASLLLASSATSFGAAIFTENFDGYSGTTNNTQYQTGLPVATGGNVPGWSKSGAGAVHAVNLGLGNMAIMFYQDNVITLTTGIAANDSGVTYNVDFDYGTAVYAGSSQATAATDGLLVEVLRPDNSVLASNTYLPGAWSNPANANLSAGLHGSFQYVGDGSGVVKLRIGPTPPLNSGFFEGEIDNISVSDLGPDITPPTVVTLSPTNNAALVAAPLANLVVTFNEAIAIGTTGDITIKNLSDNSQTTIDITSGSPQVSVAGSVLTINPTADLLAGKSYAIQIDASAIKDVNGNFFAGIADDTTWNFTTGNFVAFTTVGTTTWTAPAGVTSVQVLVVGGGGGGGWHGGGGGGAGGLNYSASYAVTPGTSYTVTVGAGGLGGVNGSVPTSGTNSSFGTLTAVGGGYGGYSTYAAHFAAAAGGSGGGGYADTPFLTGGAGTSGQGNAGANAVNESYSGGGGGAGAAGSTQNGGNGLDYSSIFGTGYGASGWFAGGGGAGGWRGSAAGTTGGTGGGGAGAPSAGSAASGLANSGGGGGGGGDGNGVCGNGGSGIVIVTYQVVIRGTIISLF